MKVKTSRTLNKIKFKKKKTARKGVCTIIQDRDSCNEPNRSRGICNRHIELLKRRGLLTKFQSERKHILFDESDYSFVKKPKPNECKVIFKRKRCKNKWHGRGLCSLHLCKFIRHDVVDKFGDESNRTVRKFKIKKVIKEGVCRIIQNGVGCTIKSKSRGLCPKHVSRFYRIGEIEKYGSKKIRG